MAGPAAILREIHRLRRHAKDLQTRVEQGPRQSKAQQARIANHEEALRQAQEALKKAKVKVHAEEVTLKTKNQQAAKYQDQFKTASTKKEYDALKLEIENARKEVSHIEDEMLEAMGAVEDQTNLLPALEKAVQEAKADAAQYESESVPRLAALAEEWRKVLGQLAEVEANVPAEIREMYDRVSKKRGEDALAAIEGRVCSSCYTEVTSQNYNELLDEKFVECKSCGRILYVPGP